MQNKILNQRDVEKMLSFINPDTTYDIWLKVLMAIKSELGDLGHSIARSWSKNSQSYNQKEFEQTWKSLKSDGGVTIASLIRQARQSGYSLANCSEIKPNFQMIWDKAMQVTNHAYLNKKLIKSYHIKVDLNGNLIIPLFINNQITGIQKISSQGEKRYITGSIKKGAYFKIGKITKDTPILLCEGYATGASLYEHMGYPVIIAFDCGNLLSVGEVIRKKYIKNSLLICADNDLHGKYNNGFELAKVAALKLDAKLCIPDFSICKETIRLTDFNDLVVYGSKEAMKHQINQALNEETEFDKYIRELSELSPIEFERIKKDAANTVGVTQGFLKSAIQLKKSDNHLTMVDCIEDVKSFEGDICIQGLFDEVDRILNQYIVLPNYASTAITLWIAGTYLFNAFRIFPKLVIISPQKRCGKSTLLDVIEALTNKSMLTSNISSSAIFRLIADCQPVLLIDEADTFIAGRNDEMIGIINSGHAKNRATVIRTVGDEHQPKVFSTWSPMVLASINPLQGPVMDRAIVIKLKRKTITEKVDRLAFDFKDHCKDIRAKLKRWAEESENLIKSIIVSPPNIGNDRAIDNWLSLFMIANLLGDKWVDQCLIAYRSLSYCHEEDSMAIQLLKDVQSILENHPNERIFTEELLNKLAQLIESPWPEYNRGRPLNGNGLSKILRQFDIHPTVMRRNDEGGIKSRRRGFEKKHFEDVFRRYLSDVPVTT